jgi:hypothetical protein
MESTLLAICLGIGLSAACGFRVFVPLLAMSLAARGDTPMIDLASGFEWISSTPALFAFATATALEIGAYYIPWLDNLLDSIASPAAVVAGTISTAALITDMDPLFAWSVAIIAGGGTAAAVQGLTVIARAASTVATGGLGNPLVSSAEAGVSVFVSALVLLIPVMGAIMVLGAAYLVIKKLISRRKSPAPATSVSSS